MRFGHRRQHPSFEELSDLQSPSELRSRMALLKRDRDNYQGQLQSANKDLEATQEFLQLAPQVDLALQQLGHQIFADTVNLLEKQLTIALQEVLEQPLTLRAQTDYKRGSATVEFFVERDGEREDIMRGQGGSVANVLSVGLRMFALAQLNPEEHRPFLMLDEPDGWLRPELVPRLVKIIHEAGSKLGFQVILISHHEVEIFRDYADRIYEFHPQPDGSVRVERHSDKPIAED